MQENVPDLLHWWKVSLYFVLPFFIFFLNVLQVNATRYPILATIARDYLAIQASSIPCERLFSMASLVDTKRRNRMSVETFSALQTLRSHLQMHRRQSVA